MCGQASTRIAGDVSPIVAGLTKHTYARTSRSHRFAAFIHYKSSVVYSHFWAHVKLLVPTLAYFPLNALLRAPFSQFRLLTSSSTTWSYCVLSFFFRRVFHLQFTVHCSHILFSRTKPVRHASWAWVLYSSWMCSPYYVVINMRCDWRTNGDRRRQEVR